MAKKSSATRQGQAARRPQTTGKQTGVALVRAGPPQQGSLAEAKPEMRTAKSATAERPAAPKAAPAPKPAPKPAVVATSAKPRAPEVVTRPAPRAEPAAAAKPAAPANRDQAARIARARAIQRARAANAISPDHYSYVLGDLKLIAGLAVAMFAVIIILHFVLPGI